jgi:hypothetical protein
MIPVDTPNPRATPELGQRRRLGDDLRSKPIPFAALFTFSTAFSSAFVSFLILPFTVLSFEEADLEAATLDLRDLMKRRSPASSS